MDITDMIFENVKVQEALQLLAALGNLDGEHVSTGVWEDGKVFFHKTDEWNTTWYVNAEDISFKQSFEDVINHIRIQKLDQNAQLVRTSALTDEASIETFGMQKQALLTINNKCDCVVNSLRGTILNKYSFPPPRVSLVLSDRTDTGYYRIRANDFIVVQNVGFDVPESAVTFRVERVSLDVDASTIQIEPLFNPDTPETSVTPLQHAQDLADILLVSHRTLNSA